MKICKILPQTIACITLAVPVLGYGQQQQAMLESPSVVSTSATTSIPAAAPLADPNKPLLGRWLDLTAFSHSQRFRDMSGDDGIHYFNNGQERCLVAGKFKLDEDGKYAIGFRASSGRSFNWAYADYAGRGFTASLNDPTITASFNNPVIEPSEAAAYAADPAGVAFVENIDSAGWEFYLRELYFSATPVHAVTMEVGSFGIERGYSSEITTFDEDGYIAGERVRFHDSKHLFFDEVSATSAYLGYFDHPNLFDRGPGFSKSNYRQVAARKQLTPRIGISGEYNWISKNTHTHTLRQALVVDVKEAKFIDKFRLETYERLNSTHLQDDDEKARQGFALVGEKKVGRLSGDFGFASIDRDYGVYTGSSFAQEVGFSLNGDAYNTGIRIFTHVNYKVTPVISATAFYTRITGQNIPNLDTRGVQAGLSFNLKELVNKERHVL